MPVAKSAPDLTIFNDATGAPLMINGQVVQMTLSPCAPGTCRVDSLHHAPPGTRWYQFNSQILMDVGPDGSADLTVDYRFSNPVDCQAWHNVTVGTWFSDDRDQRYGSIVHEGYKVFTATPLVSPWGMVAVAFVLLGAGVWHIRRTRRAVTT